MLTDLEESESSREKEQEQFEATVHESPEETGLDAPAWTPALVQQYLDETYDVEYSLPSCRRLLKETGLSYQKPRCTATEADPEEEKAFREELKKAREMDATVVCINQIKKSVQFERCAAWFPRDTRPSIELFGQRDWTCPLGAITEDGDRFSLDSKSTLPPLTRSISFLALYQEFEVI